MRFLEFEGEALRPVPAFGKPTPTEVGPEVAAGHPAPCRADFLAHPPRMRLAHAGAGVGGRTPWALPPYDRPFLRKSPDFICLVVHILRMIHKEGQAICFP